MINDCANHAPSMPRTRHPLALRVACRKAWVEGHGTLAQIAQKNQIAESTVSAWYKRDNWKRSRDRWLKSQLIEPEAPVTPQASAASPAANESRAREYDLLLQKLKTQLADENDPAKQDRLASAIGKIEDVYQVYANVVRPGTRRPRAEPLRRPSVPLMPIEDATNGEHIEAVSAPLEPAPTE